MKALKSPLRLSLIILLNLPALMSLPSMIAVAHGMLPSRELIYPGVGIDNVKIGEALPGRLPPSLEKNIRGRKIVIKTGEDQKTVEKITISSPDYILAHSQIRVQFSNLGEVLRYYGKGSMVEKELKQTVQFPTEGLEFIINKRSGKIESISVFAPSRPRIQIQQYKMYKEQYKQSR